MPTNRFKTFAISVYAGLPLEESTTTSTALTPFVLRRGTAVYPETRQFREKLDDLYGAGFGFDIYKRGNYQIVQFRMDIIHDQFVSSSDKLLAEGLRFLGQTLAQPLLENGHFADKYVQAEKQTLKKRLEAIINEKGRYAAERCLEEMCRNEAYRLNPLGQISDLPLLDAGGLYSRYQRWLEQANFDIYVVGDTTLEEVRGIVEAAFPKQQGAPEAYKPVRDHHSVSQIHRVVERLEVNQGKLNMGLRAHTTYEDDSYPAMLLYNGILGAYPHSKLFINVREKESLAYYASSRLDGHKGILALQSGIEIVNYEKAVDIILKQLEAMREGEISTVELQQTKAMLTNQLKESQDSAFEIIALDFNRVLSGKERTSSSLLEEIEKLQTEQIVQAANRVELDTIYFLRDQKEG
ncbi:pitrilysin family protein [Paenibacillus sp. y28]